MTNFNIKVADKIIAVCANFDYIRTFCSDYLTDDDADFTVKITPADISFERKKSEREEQLEGISPRNLSDEILEITAVQRKICEELFAYDTVLLHGSTISVDGVAYLFTAKSGTGKSTHTRLWREVFGERAVMVNDDKPFLSISDDDVIVHGSPWNGKHRLGTNISVPLKAICILERGTENNIHRISSTEALSMLMQQSYRPRDAKTLLKYMELIDEISQRVEFYRLFCNMESEAALVAFHGMQSR